MGTVLDHNVVLRKEPLHRSLDLLRPGVDACDATPTIRDATRGKAFPPRIPPLPLASKPDGAGPSLTLERPTGVAVADGAPFEWRDVQARTVPARAPSLPTADDFANLVFCEASEGEEAFGADPLAGRRDDDAPRRTAAIAATSATATSASTSHKKRKRRRVLFGSSVPTVHLLTDVPRCRDMTPAERSALWLGRSDLESIQSSAVASVREVRDRVRTARDGGSFAGRRSDLRALMVAMERETGSSVRGLEHRVFRRKVTRRDLIRDVLECQSHVVGLAKFGHRMDEEEGAMLLSRASQERSRKARRVAYVDARDDRREVYGDDDPVGGGGVKAQGTLKRRRRRSSGLTSV